ncbi:MAG TPA: tRNA-uridine aminocarboxypropyltransferase [Pseudohongiella sp.]|nr:tRNA-uridine aminocarboxypropyltransferase [Pseudohongiella sp.]
MSRSVCSQCLRPHSVCYCARIVSQSNNWPISIIQDVREAKHAIGTARIAMLSLENCALIPFDPERPHNDALHSLQTAEPVLIYPGPEARPVTELAEQLPRPLIFIDASWRRSRRIMHSLPWLQQLPSYSLNPETVSRYRIRKQPQASALSTLEAIVCCLQLLENNPGRFDSLLAVMDWMIEKQISHMGEETWLKNYRSEEKS